MKTTIIRGFATLLALSVWGWINFAINAAAPLISGATSVEQLKDSDQAYFVSKFGAQFNGAGLPTIILLFVLALIWWKPVSRAFESARKSHALLLVGALLIISVGNVHAYYDTKNQVEFVTIKPNQTAFMVPQQGKNLEGQAAFDSAAYLDKTKIAEKRIEIPHVVLPKKGMQWDVYIPASVLYIVTREPYVRQWSKSAAKGTSSKNEGFSMESSESLNIECDISAGAHIKITDSALYLYNFGVSNVVNAGDNADFPSVVYAQTLEHVMDTKVHQRVQVLLAKEFGKRKLDDCIAEKAVIMAAVETQVIEEYGKLGITIEYVGYGSPLELGKKIQEAIDTVYIAKKMALASEDQMKAMAARSALADVMIKEGVATAATKWNGQISLPSFMVLPSDTFGALKGLFGKSPLAGTEAVKAEPAKK